MATCKPSSNTTNALRQFHTDKLTPNEDYC